MKKNIINNVFWQPQCISRTDREILSGHKSFLIWFTGLSGAGKSTISQAVAARLHQLNCKTFVLDGDNIRHGLCSDLGFSKEDRSENIRRVSEVAKLFVEAGIITLAAFISPTAQDRNFARSLFAPNEIIEVYCKCTIDVCESRDVKGIYKKARAGHIKNFTGIDAPYEAPENPDLTLDTETFSIEQSTERVILLLVQRGLICTSSDLI